MTLVRSEMKGYAVCAQIQAPDSECADIRVVPPARIAQQGGRREPNSARLRSPPLRHSILVCDRQVTSRQETDFDRGLLQPTGSERPPHFVRFSTTPTVDLTMKILPSGYKSGHQRDELRLLRFEPVRISLRNRPEGHQDLTQMGPHRLFGSVGVVRL